MDLGAVPNISAYGDEIGSTCCGKDSLVLRLILCDELKNINANDKVANHVPVQTRAAHSQMRRFNAPMMARA